jgi:hypothetical protein
MAPPHGGGNTFLQRLIGAAALDAAIYEEVEEDAGATVQAMIVVLLSSVAAGVGATGLGAHIGAIAFFSTVALISWAAWALVTFEIGSRLLPGPDTRVTPGQLLRTIGFSATPGMMAALGVMRAVAVPAFIVSSVWMLLAMIVAVRQALDYPSTARAVAVCALGWVLALTFALALGMLFGPTVS